MKYAKAVKNSMSENAIQSQAQLELGRNLSLEEQRLISTKFTESFFTNQIDKVKIVTNKGFKILF